MFYVVYMCLCLIAGVSLELPSPASNIILGAIIYWALAIGDRWFG